MNKEEKIEKEIEVLTHIQEEYRFNYQILLNNIQGFFILIFTIYVPLITLGLNFIFKPETRNVGYLLITLSVIIPLILIIKVVKSNGKEIKKTKTNYNLNTEKMKGRYKLLGIDADELLK